MQSSAAKTYLEAKVMTATTEQLQMMLYEGAVRFAQQMRLGLVEVNLERAQLNYERADAILCELHAGLRPERDSDLVDKFSALYQFCQRRLDEAMIQREPSKVDDALVVLRHLLKTWELVMENIESRETRDSIDIEQAYEPLTVSA